MMFYISTDVGAFELPPASLAESFAVTDPDDVIWDVFIEKDFFQEALARGVSAGKSQNVGLTEEVDMN